MPHIWEEERGVNSNQKENKKRLDEYRKVEVVY